MKVKTLFPFLFIALVILAVVLDTQRRKAQTELHNVTVLLEQLQGNDVANQEKANQVIKSVQEIMDIDVSVQPTVATIVDVEKLRKQNPFYDKAKNGDFLIVTTTRAILYDDEAEKILDVVPVQIEQKPTEQDPSVQ